VNALTGEIGSFHAGVHTQAMCCDVLRWLLALPGLRVPGDCPQPGERRVTNQTRTVHTLSVTLERIK